MYNSPIIPIILPLSLSWQLPPSLGKRGGAKSFLLARLRLRCAPFAFNTISPTCCVRLAPPLLPRDRSNCQLRSNEIIAIIFVQSHSNVPTI